MAKVYVAYANPDDVILGIYTTAEKAFDALVIDGRLKEHETRDRVLNRIKSCASIQEVELDSEDYVSRKWIFGD